MGTSPRISQKTSANVAPFERFLGFSGFSPGDAGDAEG